MSILKRFGSNESRVSAIATWTERESTRPVSSVDIMRLRPLVAPRQTVNVTNKTYPIGGSNPF